MTSREELEHRIFLKKQAVVLLKERIAEEGPGALRLDTLIKQAQRHIAEMEHSLEAELETA